MTVVAPFEVDPEALERLPAERQEEVLAQLAELTRRSRANPQFRWAPHEGELGWKRAELAKLTDRGVDLVPPGLRIHGDESRGQVEFLEQMDLDTVAAVAGNRFGKTEVGCEFCLIQLLGYELLPPWLHRYKIDRFAGRELHVRAIGVDIPRWLNKALLPKLRKLVPPEALFKGSWEKAWKDRDQKLQFADGSWWDFLTHDMDVDSFASADLDIAWFDEEPPGEKGRQQWEETGMRLADRDGVERWTLTPLLGLSFVYHELTDAHGQPRQDDECHVVVGDIDHNPHLSEKGRRRALRRFEKDPLKLQARKSGRWVHFAGLIYPSFSPARHVVPERGIPRAHEKAAPLVPIFEAIDPGINEQHKAAFGVAFLDWDDVCEFVYSIALADLNVEQVCEHIHMVRAMLGYSRPRWTKIDPSAKNRQHISGRNVQDEYRKHGVHTMPAQNSHELGFNAVRQRLDSDRVKFQAGRCDGLIAAFPEYRWKSPRGQQVDKPRAEPIKRNDDELDMARYLIVDLPKPPEKERPDEDPGDFHTQAFRQHLRRLRNRTGRVGGVMPIGRGRGAR